MSTYVIYAGADGKINSVAPSVYANARSGAGTLTASDADVFVAAGQLWDGVDFYCFEGFLSFDTSSVSGTVTSAVLALALNSDASTQDFTINARASDWGASLTAGDWVAGASLTGLPLRASFASASLSAGYNSFTSDSSFVSSVASPVRLLLSSSRHEGNNQPVGDEYVTFKSSETTGTSEDPKLTIVTPDAGGAARPRRTPLRRGMYLR